MTSKRKCILTFDLYSYLMQQSRDCLFKSIWLKENRNFCINKLLHIEQEQ